MRFAQALFMPAALALAHCSSPVAATSDAAWEVKLYGGAMCAIGDSDVKFGDSALVSGDILTRVTDGEVVKGGTEPGQTAHVTCAVIPSGGGFQVQAQTTIGADALQISIPKIDGTASATMPATGNVVYQSSGTVNAYTGNCNFYFENGGEGVDAGKFFAAFTCDGLTYGSNPPSVCAAGSTTMPNYFAVESCGTSPLF